MNMGDSVRGKDWVDFHCRLCGGCCRDIRGQIMVEPLDAYRLARLLRNRGAVESMEDLYTNYTYPDILEGLFPVFLMNPVGADDSCIFFGDGQCSVYEAHPRVCRLYPFAVFPGQRGKSFKYLCCSVSHSSHFAGGRVLVKDWMYQNFTREDQAFLTMESSAILEIARILKALGRNRLEAFLFQIQFHCYYNYDLDELFLPQYESNMGKLKQFIRDFIEN